MSDRLLAWLIGSKLPSPSLDKGGFARRIHSQSVPDEFVVSTQSTEAQSDAVGHWQVDKIGGSISTRCMT
jgi:hypothetical protein